MKKSLLFVFLTVIFSFTCSYAKELTDREWEAMKEKARNRQRRTIIDNDIDDINYHKIGTEPTIEELLAIRTSFMHKYPVDTFCVNVNGSMQMMNIPTKYGEMIQRLSNDSYSMVPILHKKYNTDILKLSLEYCRKHNIEVFAEFRINDTHDACDTPFDPCPYFAKFKRDNPHLLMGSYTQRPRYGNWSSYDFTHKEVRDLFVNLVTEVAENYEIDGIFIDLYRWIALFKSVAYGAEASDEERAMFTDMLMQIRRKTDEIGRKRQRPILIAIRFPDSLGYSRAIGFDWENLMKKGAFDMAFVADNHHLNYWGKSIELCHKYNVKCYPSISMPCFVNLPRLSRHDQRSYFAREAGAWAAGADGLFFYNIFGEAMVEKTVRASFEDIRTKDKRYHISGMVHWRPSSHLATGEKYNELPELSPVTTKELPPGKTREFKLEFGDDLKALRKEGLPVNVEATLLADGIHGAVEIKSNNVVWKYVGSMGDSHRYIVPDEALKPGLNTVVFRNKSNSVDKKNQIILSGRELLKGGNQPPWRRIFRGNPDNPEAEKIVDNFYRFSDNGIGCHNLVYPLDTFDKNVEISFELKTENTDAPESAALRLACNGKVEVITFGKGQIGLLYGKKSVPFDTTKLNKYTVNFNTVQNRISVKVNNKTVISNNKLASSDDKATEMQGVSEPMPDSNVRTLVVGSLSDAGKGVSYWKNLSILRSAGNVRLKDLAVEVRLTPPPAPTKINSWEYSANNAKMLKSGIYPYHTHYTVAEADVDIARGPVTLYFSNGGLWCKMRLDSTGVTFDDGLPALPLAPKAEPYTVRAELGDTVGKIFIDGNFIEVSLKSVSMFIRDNAQFRELNINSENILRNSGIVAVQDSGNAVKAMRSRIFAPADAAAKSKAAMAKLAPMPDNGELIFSFDAEDLIDKTKISNNYAPDVLKVENGKLFIDNGAEGKSNYAIFKVLNTAELLKDDASYLAKAKINIKEVSPAASGAVYFSLDCGSTKTRSLTYFVAPGKIVIGGYGTLRTSAIKSNTDHEIAVLFNPANGDFTVWVDGKIIDSKNIVIDTQSPAFSFGDGSGAVSGKVFVEELELFKIK